MTPKRTAFTVGVCICAVIILHNLGWLFGIEDLLRNLNLPIMSQMHNFNVRVGTNYELFKNRADLETAYAACTIRTQENSATLAKLTLLESENATLKEQLHFITTTNTPFVIASVVGKEILSPDQTIIINRGSEDAIKMNDPVINGSGILVGKITKVDSHMSMVRLINDSGSKVGAMILNKSQSQGVVEGGYNISLIMSFIPRDEIIKKGDQVVTSGLETGMPRGLLIGTISVVENEPYKPFQEAYVEPTADLSKLSLVSVLKTQ